MKAAVMYGVDQPLVIEDIDIDEPRANEVLIRTSATGVCHSDLHFMEGKYPMACPAVLGHESAGIVEQIGDEVPTSRSATASSSPSSPPAGTATAASRDAPSSASTPIASAARTASA